MLNKEDSKTLKDILNCFRSSNWDWNFPDIPPDQLCTDFKNLALKCYLWRNLLETTDIERSKFFVDKSTSISSEDFTEEIQPESNPLIWKSYVIQHRSPPSRSTQYFNKSLLQEMLKQCYIAVCNLKRCNNQADVEKGAEYNSCLFAVSCILTRMRITKESLVNLADHGN